VFTQTAFYYHESTKWQQGSKSSSRNCQADAVSHRYTPRQTHRQIHMDMQCVNG